MTRLLIIIAVFAAWMPGVCAAWWNDDWAFRKKLSVAPAATEGQSVPLLVRLHSGNFGYFTDTEATGADLRFIAQDDATLLKHHIEKFDPVNAMALIWVQAPAGAQTLWMYYGNPEAGNAADAAAAYDAQQTAVYHFSDAATGPKDSTAYANTLADFSAQPTTAALIGGGIEFAGAQRMVIADSPALRTAAGQGFTFSAWIKTDVLQADAVLLARGDNANALTIGIQQNSPYASLNVGGNVIATPPAPALPLAEWHHLAVTLGQQLSIYIDGKEVATIAAAVPALSGPITLGATATGERFLAAELDEVQFSNIARPAAFLRAQAQTQAPDTTLLSYGDDEQGGGAEDTAYFTTILRSVTLDGWVIIGVLAIMAAVSLLVMAAKTFVLNRMEKSNRQFRSAYQKLGIQQTAALDREESDTAGDIQDSELLTALFGKQDHYQNSPLYHLYHTGVQEMRHRLGVSLSAAAAGLSAPAIEAIRASLDAVMVREMQRLNSQMVLLTIAISGGPFLGLLGTVVGVMITFAAIAATGDVNINAIAPGIAAALVATVAGLAVAIPALFGYNYLITRIKNVTADMQVFVDEFITRMAEMMGRAA